MIHGLQAVLPGRLNDLVIEQVIINNEPNLQVVAFHFALFGDLGNYITGVVSQYDMQTGLWMVIFENASFENIPVSTGKLCDADAVRAIQKVLVELDSKKPRCIDELKRMRRLLDIRPVKVVTLKK